MGIGFVITTWAVIGFAIWAVYSIGERHFTRYAADQREAEYKQGKKIIGN